MADFTTNAIADGLASIREARGESVSYARGSEFTVAGVLAILTTFRESRDGNSEFDLDGTYRDCLVGAADLANGGAAVVPKVGDTITTATGSVFRVVEPAGTPAWEWSDAGESQRRIHTVEVPQ